MTIELSIKEKIDYVMNSKNKIHRSSVLITSYLQKMANKTEDDDKLISLLKREIRTINKELTNIGGFCEKKVQSRIIDLCTVGSMLSGYQRSTDYIMLRVLIDNWTTQANSLLLDFNRSPFKISGGFEVSWDIFKAFLKGEYNPK